MPHRPTGLPRYTTQHPALIEWATQTHATIHAIGIGTTATHWPCRNPRCLRHRRCTGDWTPTPHEARMPPCTRTPEAKRMVKDHPTPV